MNLHSNLQGKHAIVTGGARGIGLAVARNLLAYGAHVSVTGRKPAAPETLSEFAADRLQYYSMDVCDTGQIQRAFAAARESFGGVDILINNAGEAASAPFLKTSEDLWRRLMAVNLDGTYHASQAALPDMLAAGWGRIVNVASIAGLTGAAYISAYCASKHGVIGLTRALAVELASKGVTVNAVCPGYTDTDMVKYALTTIVEKTGRTHEQALAELTARNPQKRLVTPEEVANAVAWLCLPGSEAVNGQAIAIAGGEVM